MPITLSLAQLITIVLLTAIIGCTIGMTLLSMLVIGRQSDHDEMGVRLSQSDSDEPTAKELASEIKTTIGRQRYSVAMPTPDNFYRMRDVLIDVQLKCDCVINDTWRE